MNVKRISRQSSGSALQRRSQTEQPISTQVEKKLFQKQSGNEVEPPKEAQDSHYYCRIYDQPAGNKKDEATRPEFVSVFLCDPRKRRYRNETKEHPDGVDVMNVGNKECCSTQNADHQRRAY